MGGASSVDKMYRKENVSWWKEETPSNIEYETAIENLEKNNWEVDYIITHTAPNEIINKILCMYKIDEVSSFLNFINNNTKFKHWYFGHFHDDLSFEKHTMLFNKIIEIKD